ncbi:hypothetical protein E4U44_003835 [Claviceps purpurea]|nr:hypothetical protein E4U44_003835 [Claviceps purpurea]
MTAATNVSRQKKHLESCEKYYRGQATKEFSNEATRSFEDDNPTKVLSPAGFGFEIVVMVVPWPA